jgi:ATP-dependent helicase HepA
MSVFIAGQRWMSESEPELGLGTVVQAGADRVAVNFTAAGETRTYAIQNAPLKRIRFRVGDTIQTDQDEEMIVAEVLERDGLLVYVGTGNRVPEARVSDRLSLHGPEDRLLAGRFDEPAVFELRRRSLLLSHRSRKSPVRGFVGGRINLIPHQLYIAQEVAGRQSPRVMLSDEVGLGKTIEACLILHRLLLSGRADRMLVLVPESLVHQWFVEMLRRFNVWLNIFDEPRCAAIEAGDPEANPFLDDQLVLTSIQFLAESPRRAAQAAAAGWNILVVDEAHHLEWSQPAPSREYQVVETLSRQSEGLLLLTATPEQLGAESHFARLRLLDPNRYRDFVTFKAESKDYKPAADVAEKLLSGKQPSAENLVTMRRLLAHDERLESRLQALGRGSAEARQGLLEDVLDLHGPGRVLFRNTRANMTGFPKRFARLVRIEAGPAAEEWIDRVSTEFAADAGDISLPVSLDLARDPRILWLVELLRKLRSEKVLLICRSVEKAEAIDEALRRHLNLKMGVFHEGLTLVQRDRNAAWFAEPDGARLLICSEIGSEGRNFQFSHHLVLFDLPLNPEPLEQRIGRLDRIGQTHDIQIHVPYLARSPQEVLARWYHEGLNALETNIEGGNELFHAFSRPVRDLALEFPVANRSAAERELEDLLGRTKAACHKTRRLLAQGRDRLLELNSFRPAAAEKLIAQIIKETEQQSELEGYMLDVFEHFGVHIEELAPHTWRLNPEGVRTDSFPAMPTEGLVATCDRRRALSREDVAFLTWDHPMVTGAMELLLGSETGNCAFAVLPAEEERTLLLELIFVLEVIAPSSLHVDRFLPPTPVRLVVDHRPKDVTESHGVAALEKKLRKGSPYRLLDNADLTRRILPAMMRYATSQAEARAIPLRQAALQEMNRLLAHEVQRLKNLLLINDHVRPEEIEQALAQQSALATALGQARVRLDALRLIWNGPTSMME